MKKDLLEVIKECRRRRVLLKHFPYEPSMFEVVAMWKAQVSKDMDMFNKCINELIDEKEISKEKTASSTIIHILK